MTTGEPKQKKDLQLADVLHFLALLLVILVCVFPFYWMVTSSFKQQSAILASTPQFIFQPTLENYVNAFTKFDILKSLQNSLFVALVTVFISLVLGTPAAYAIARFEFKGKRDIWFWFISNRMLSPIVVALPFFLIARNFRLLDTTWALILILRTADILKLFDVVYTMTRGGPGSATELISVYIQRIGFRVFDQGLASAQAVVLLVIATILSRLYVKYVYKEI